MDYIRLYMKLYFNMGPKALGSYFGICKQSEVLILSIVGIFCTIFDTSLLNLWPDLQRIWTVLMDPVKMPIIMHLYIRYILSGIVIAQAFSLHVYLASYVVLMYPACTMERPQLILPWLLIGTVKTILLCSLTFATGLYVCFMYRFMRPACWDFLLTQLVTHGPSFYMWGLILSYYNDLRKIEGITRDIEITPVCTGDISKRRKRAKSLMQSSHYCSLYDDYDDNRPFISASTIENMVHHLGCARKNIATMSRSLDTLVGEMEMEADRQLLLGVENEESFITDENMSIEEKTAQLLQVSPMEIVRAKRERKFIRQIASTSRMTILSTVAFRSRIDVSSVAQVVSTNATINQDQEERSTITANIKSSCDSETEIRVVQLNSSKCLVEPVIEKEKTDFVMEPLESKITKKMEVVYSGSDTMRRIMNNYPPIKKNLSYQSLSSRSKKSVHIIEPILPNLPKEIQIKVRGPYKYDGYTEAYFRKKQHEEKIRLRNLK